VKREREPLSDGGYQRPQQAWQCGLADEGPACPLGPSAGGHCPAAAACRPVRDGDRWQCNRSLLRGGPCGEGPGPDGQCAIVYRCTPVRALRTRRGRFVAVVAAAALGTACMMLGGSWRNELIAPGPLSVHHAQLLEGDRQSLRCAQCHAAGGASLSQWWAHTIHGEPLGPAQSTLCLKCHGTVIGSDVALAAHNAPALFAGGGDAPALASFDERRRDPREPIECAACHREHHGAEHHLSAVSNTACQACHQHEFESFAHGHPDFGDWPYEQPTRIAFNHASHEAKHFPAEKQSFACAACHEASLTGEVQLTRPYEAACASCHDKSIAASLTDGLPLFSLPTIDVEALAAAGKAIGPWPEEANGDFDGGAPWPAKLLTAADPRGAAALAKLGPQFDLIDVDPDNAAQTAAAGDAAAALAQLIGDLADKGQATIGERLETVLGRKLTAAELEALAAKLSPDVVRGYRDQWFKPAGAEDASAKDLAEDRAAQRARVSSSGWLRDDASLSLRYLAAGHADPWLRAWLDVLAEAASSPRPGIAALGQPLLESAMKPTAPGQCGSCHRAERDAAGRWTIHWRALAAELKQRTFTRFDHGPHVTAIRSDNRLPEGGQADSAPQTPQNEPFRNSDCTSCHQVPARAESDIADFAPLAKASCAECHTPRAAGDSCVQCHQYHGSGQ
jgi:hypothetical protein